MNPQELRREVAKYKARRRKTRLAYYSLLISSLLALSSFSTGVHLATLTAFAFFFPLPLYFFFQSLKLFRKSHLLHRKVSELESNISLLESKFSFKKFISQPNLTFRLSLALLMLICFTTLARTRTANTALTTTPTSLAVNR